MARRRSRKGLVAILFPELHRSYRRAKREMRPGRVLGRVLSVPEIKSALRTQTVRMNAQSRQAQVQRATEAAAKKTAAKKSAAPDPYAIAAGIPQRNQRAAAQARAGQSGAKKTVAVRKKNGQFDGRKTMRADDLGTYERAASGFVDPALRARSPRRRGGG